MGQKVKWPTTKRCIFFCERHDKILFPGLRIDGKKLKIYNRRHQTSNFAKFATHKGTVPFGICPERGLIRISRILRGIHGTVFESRPNHSKLTPTKIRADANFFCAGFALAGVWKYLCVFRRQLRTVEVFFKGSLRACYRTLVFQRSVWKQFGQGWPCSFPANSATIKSH